MDEVTAAVVDELLRDIASTRGPTARNHTRNQGSQIWRWAKRIGLWSGSNPWSGAGRAKTKSRRNPLIGDDAHRIDQLLWRCFRGAECSLVSPVHAGYFLLLNRTAARRSEGTHARWDEFDLVKATWTIGDHKTVRRTGAKTIPLVPSAIQLLEEIREREWSETFLFPSNRSRRGHIEDPWPAWKRLRDAAGCPDVRIHDIRHGFAKMMHDSGAPLTVVRDMLGHASIRTTELYVGRTSVDAVREAAARTLDRLGGGR